MSFRVKRQTQIKWHYGINEADGPTNTTGIIYAKNGDTPDNVSRIKIVVTPKTQIEQNDVITIRIKASTQEPYQKEISCEISLRIQQVLANSYEIEDIANRNYLTLKVINTHETGGNVSLEFDPNVVRIDLNDEAYINRVEGSEEVNSDGYVEKFVFTMDKESAENIKFYKVDMSQDYTYPSGDTSSIITVNDE